MADPLAPTSPAVASTSPSSSQHGARSSGAPSPDGAAAAAGSANAAAAATGPVRNLVVANLPRAIDTAQLRAMFSEFGQLITALVMMDVGTGKSRGFGFVWFEKADDAKRAMEAMDGKEYSTDGKKLKVFPSEHPDGLSEAAAIAVLNFPASVARSHGHAIFAQFGTIVRFELAPVDARSSGTSAPGAGNTTINVEYAEVLQARAAVNALHGEREIRFDTVHVNLQLPLVTKYLLPGAHRPGSRTASQRTTPHHSASAHPYASRSATGMNASGSRYSAAMGSGHTHPMAFATHSGTMQPQHAMMPGTMQPMQISPGSSGNNAMMFMPAPQHPQPMAAPGTQPFFFAPQPQMQQAPPQQSVFNLPQQQQPMMFAPTGGQQGQPVMLPPGYVIVPAGSVQGQQQQQQPPMNSGGNFFFSPPPPQGQQQQPIWAPQQPQQHGQGGQPFFFAPPQ